MVTPIYCCFEIFFIISRIKILCYYRIQHYRSPKSTCVGTPSPWSCNTGHAVLGEHCCFCTWLQQWFSNIRWEHIINWHTRFMRKITYPVSYTHLDVYKRQILHLIFFLFLKILFLNIFAWFIAHPFWVRSVACFLYVDTVSLLQ